MGFQGTVVFLAAFCIAAPAIAQTEGAPLPSRSIAQPIPLLHAESPAQQLAALQRWTRDYAEWEEWFLRWRSQVEPGLWSSKPRRQPPVPPPWLADSCVSVLVDSGPLADACRAWREWIGG